MAQDSIYFPTGGYRDRSNTDATAVNFAPMPVFPDDPLAPEYIQFLYYSSFESFEKVIDDVCTALAAFRTAAKQIRHSSNLLDSSLKLAQCLSDLRHELKRNAKVVCPGRIADTVARAAHNDPATTEWDAIKDQQSTVDTGTGIRAIASSLEDAAEALKRLGGEIISLSQFQDKKMQVVCATLAIDLGYWAETITGYDHHTIINMAVRRYICDAVPELTTRLDTLIGSISYFTLTIVPMIAITQHHDPANIQNLTTVATFFSAVSAATLQFSYAQPYGTTTAVVNGFWFSSLVFSVASTVNLLLGALLMRFLHRASVRVPRPIYLWLYASPLVFLVVAVASFSAGLVIFAYASDQDRPVSIVTTAFSGLVCVGIVAVVGWFIAAYTSSREEEDQLSFLQLPETKPSRYSLALNTHPVALPPTSPVSPREADLSPSGQHQRWSAYPMSPFHAHLPTRSNTNQSFRPFATVPAHVIMGIDAAPGWLLPSPHSNSTSSVCDVKFSPDSALLAVAGGRTFSSVWHVVGLSSDGQMDRLYRLLHKEEGRADQVEWSPDGMYLMTKHKEALMVWHMKTGRLERKFLHHRRIKFASWRWDSLSLVSLEDGLIVVSRLDGESTPRNLPVPYSNVRAMALVEGASGPWLVAGVIQMSPPDHAKPSKHKLLKRALIVHDITTNALLTEAPLFHDISRISVTQDENGWCRILVHYEDKMCPQLWELRSQATSSTHAKVSLVLTQAYPLPGIMARLCSFGGDTDDLVLCSDQTDGIYVFRRDSGTCELRIDWSTPPSEQKCIAWNRSCQAPTAGKNDHMFATGSVEEGVQIWAMLDRRDRRQSVAGYLLAQIGLRAAAIAHASHPDLQLDAMSMA